MSLFEQFPYTNFHEINLDWVLQKLKEWDGQIQQFAVTLEAMKDYEKSADITSKRKLTPNGNFTGTIQGRASNLILAGIDGNAQQLKYLADQFADGQTGLVIDGGYFENEGIDRNYNGGRF